MAKKKIHIDELFRRELGDMKMPVDTNDWAAMQAQIAAEQNKRKRRALWWWFAGIALLLTGSLTTYYLLSSENTKQNDIVVENATPSPSIKKPQANNTPLSIDRETENTTSNLSTDGKETTPNNAETNSSDKPLSSSKQPSTKKETKKPKSNISPELKKRLLELKNRQNGKQKDNGNSEGSTGNGRGGMDSPYPKNERRNKPKETPKPSTTNDIDSNTNKETTTTKVATPDSTKTVDDSSKIVDGNMLRRSRATKSKLELSPFSLGFHIGGATNNFVAENNSQLGRIINSENENSIALSAEISANYKIKNFEINSGIGVRTIHQSVNYNYTHQIKDSVPVLSPQGDIIGYFYTNFRDTTHDLFGSSSFQYVTIPIGVTYNKEINQKSGVRFSANTTLHYLEFVTGDYINPFNLLGMSVDRNRDLFRKWNLGLGASIGYYSKISEQFTFEGSINYNTLTNGIFDNRIGTAIRPSSIGINVGIRYNFKLRK